MLWQTLALVLLSALGIGGAVAWWLHVMRPAYVGLDIATVAGLLSLAALFLLGFGTGQELFSLYAVFAIPAFLMLGMWAGNARRLDHRAVRLYICAAISASGLCWVLVLTNWVAGAVSRAAS